MDLIFWVHNSCEQLIKMSIISEDIPTFSCWNGKRKNETPRWSKYKRWNPIIYFGLCLTSSWIPFTIQDMCDIESPWDLVRFVFMTSFYLNVFHSIAKLFLFLLRFHFPQFTINYPGNVFAITYWNLIVNICSLCYGGIVKT